MWLKTLREMHAAHTAAAASGVSSSPLPMAPMAWRQPTMEEVGLRDTPSGFGGVDERFAGIALDDADFDAPVYRSLAGLFADDAATGAVGYAEEDELPIYRSLSGAFEGDSPARDPLAPEEADRAWLQSMPPLIQRQNAHVLSSIVIPH